MYGLTRNMLVALTAARGGYAGARTWFGAVSDLRSHDPSEIAIAKHLGLAPGGSGTFQVDTLKALSLEEAKAALAYAAVESMAYPNNQAIPPKLVEALDEGFAPLGPDVCCFSNGYWPRCSSWLAMTNATFDTGVICHNGEVGFAFWVDEED